MWRLSTCACSYCGQYCQTYRSTSHRRERDSFLWTHKREEHLLSSNQPAAGINASEQSPKTALNPTVSNTVTPPSSHALQYKPQQCRQQYCVKHCMVISWETSLLLKVHKVSVQIEWIWVVAASLSIPGAEGLWPWSVCPAVARHLCVGC